MLRFLPHGLATQLEFTVDGGHPVRQYFAYGDAGDALRDTRGVTVRWAPWRRTVMHDLGGRLVFCKHRRGRIWDALREKAALRQLAGLGLNVPRLLFFGADGRDTVIGLEAVPGRPLDALLAEGLDVDRALAEMPVVVRRLHEAGWVYRDLYWNHVFAQEGGSGLWLVDVERAFQPRFRFERWRIKDLAGMVSSWPAAAPISRAAGLRFLRDALGGLPPGYKDLTRRVIAKAGRIRGHVTKYPG